MVNYCELQHFFTRYKEDYVCTMQRHIYAQRSSQLTTHTLCTMYIFYREKKAACITQCILHGSFEFSKMTTEGAVLQQISVQGFQLKKGKI